MNSVKIVKMDGVEYDVVLEYEPFPEIFSQDNDPELNTFFSNISLGRRI